MEDLFASPVSANNSCSYSVSHLSHLSHFLFSMAMSMALVPALGVSPFSPLPPLAGFFALVPFLDARGTRGLTFGAVSHSVFTPMMPLLVAGAVLLAGLFSGWFFYITTAAFLGLSFHLMLDILSGGKVYLPRYKSFEDARGPPGKKRGITWTDFRARVAFRDERFINLFSLSVVLATLLFF